MSAARTADESTSPRAVFIYGTGMHARKVWHALQAAGLPFGGFIHGSAERPALDYSSAPMLSHAEALALSQPAALIVAIGDGAVRQRLHGVFGAAGWQLASVLHPAAHVCTDANVGQGVFVGAGAVIETLARIGEGAIVDIGVLIDHEAEVAPFVHVKPGDVLPPRSRR